MSNTVGSTASSGASASQGTGSVQGSSTTQGTSDVQGASTTQGTSGGQGTSPTQGTSGFQNSAPAQGSSFAQGLGQGPGYIPDTFSYSGGKPPWSDLITADAVGPTDDQARNQVRARSGFRDIGNFMAPSDKAGQVEWGNDGTRNLGSSWYYNYSTNPSDIPENQGKQFVPMFSKDSSVTPENIQAAQNAQAVLAFNEPDNGNIKDGSAMPVDQAVADWKKIQGVNGELVSPAAVQPTGPWMQEFMGKLQEQHLRMPDAIAVHCYPSSTGSVDDQVNAVKEQVEAAHNMWHKPIWVTELGADIGFSGSPEFYDKVQKMLDGLPYVERYSPFHF